jgi:hypothetical protein
LAPFASEAEPLGECQESALTAGCTICTVTMYDRPVYCGNFEYDATVRGIERLFEKYGDVARVDMKTGKDIHYKILSCIDCAN